jgi:hypothetical protein
MSDGDNHPTSLGKNFYSGVTVMFVTWCDDYGGEDDCDGGAGIKGSTSQSVLARH